jgi:hypothetical protein
MAKNKSKVAVDTAAEPTTTAPVAAQASNHTLTYRRTHPGNRCSYGIAGQPGIVVFDLRMFADGKPPATIVLDCALALPVAKVAKAKSVAA